MKVSVTAKAHGATMILRDVAFEVAPGAVVAIAGPSGVGKTTLLRIIAGLDTAFTGRVDGAGRIGFVFQAPTLLPWRSAVDNIRIAARTDRAAALAALGEVGLAERADAYPGALSLGQQRRVALARAFAAAPDLLLMDEPFVSLDPDSAERMRALTLAMLARRGARALIVTHDLAEAVSMADRVLALNGAPAALRLDKPLGSRGADRDAAWIAREVAALRAALGG